MVFGHSTWSLVTWHGLWSSVMLEDLLMLGLILVSVGAELSVSRLLAFNLCMGYLISVVVDLCLDLY